MSQNGVLKQIVESPMCWYVNKYVETQINDTKTGEEEWIKNVFSTSTTVNEPMRYDKS